MSFKINKVSTIAVVDRLPSEIFRLLCVEKRSLSFCPIDDAVTGPLLDESESDELFEGPSSSMTNSDEQTPLFRPYVSETLSANFVDDALQTGTSAENLDHSSRRIDEQARTILEEQGVNALFLALGMLHYVEGKDSSIIFKAPLILVPVDLLRKSALETGLRSE